MERVWNRTLRSAVQLLVQPFTRTDFFKRGFRFSTPSVWNSLSQTVLTGDCLFFNLDLKLLLFTQAFIEHWSRPAASASEVTIVWCYINSTIIIFLSAELTYQPRSSPQTAKLPYKSDASAISGREFLSILVLSSFLLKAIFLNFRFCSRAGFLLLSNRWQCILSRWR